MRRGKTRTLDVTEGEYVMANKYIVVSGVIFGLIAGAHVVRALGDVPVQLGTAAIPVWVSWVGAVVAGALSVWAFRSRR
jgi:hypothetical protein